MHNMLPEAFQANLNRNPLLNTQRSAPAPRAANHPDSSRHAGTAYK